jgi:hypothetical protein
MPLITNGPIFTKLKAKLLNWAQPTEDCVVGTVTELLAKETSDDRPGMLLGQIQSGKTRAFVGSVALAFDSGYELAIVLTKGTKALAKQTQARLVNDLKIAFDEELVLVFDIRLLPETLTEWQLARKLVIVCKKEDDNLNALYDAITDTYEELSQKRALIVDDEADFTSVGYRRTPHGVIAAVIPTQIDVLRQALTNASFLQVTATPYSLYLQPENVEIPATGAVFKPIRPAFTKVVPVHAGYIGGKYYFEDSQVPGSVPSFLRVDVSLAELDVLKQEDRARFKIEECLTSDGIEGLRRSIITFIVGAWIRRGHPGPADKPRPRYAFIVHTHTTRAAHDWQAQVVRTLLSHFRGAAETDINSIRTLVEQAHSDLSQSLGAGELPIPAIDEVLAALPNELRAVAITTVNSNRDINMLLDEATGQLRLDNPYNVFIGGNILDRGLTIDNLIGFYYGRNPRIAQQDTVLQHARMYGNRPLEDMAVTRFYTTPANYNRMRTIYEFDAALRDAFDQGGQEGEVVILRNDPARTFIPCAPNKLLISDIVALRPGRRLIPKGFSTNLNTAATTNQIDQILTPYMNGENRQVFHLPLDVAIQIIDMLATALEADADGVWDANAFKASMKYLASQNPDEARRQEVVCLATLDRNDRKRRQDGRLQDAPESSDDDAKLDPKRGDRPALLLYRENGSVDRGWAGQSFFWPVLQAPPAK